MGLSLLMSPSSLPLQLMKALLPPDSTYCCQEALVEALTCISITCLSKRHFCVSYGFFLLHFLLWEDIQAIEGHRLDSSQVHIVVCSPHTIPRTLSSSQRNTP